MSRVNVSFTDAAIAVRESMKCLLPKLCRSYLKKSAIQNDLQSKSQTRTGFIVSMRTLTKSASSKNMAYT